MKSILSYFKKAPKEDKGPKRLADVADEHLGALVKVWSLSHVTKTSLILFIFLITIIGSIVKGQAHMFREDYVAQIRMDGGMNDNDGGTGYQTIQRIKSALDDSKVAAVLLVVNSGGGSPTQGEMLYEYLREYTSATLKDERKPIVVSIQGVCASACYYAVSPADLIVAHRSSLVGSIGVRMDGWDVRDVAERIGVNRETLTSGKYKSILDPFRGMSEDDEMLLREQIIDPMFAQFKSDVIAARQGKLVESEDLFSGFVWPGEKSVELGLIDEIRTLSQIEEHLISNTSATHVVVMNRQGFSFGRALSGVFSDAIQSFFEDSSVIH